MSTLDILTHARNRITNIHDWCQNHDREGNKRCAYSAICEATKSLSDTVKAANVLRADPELNGSTVSDYNDNHTHSEVLALFDRTIERLKKENP